MPYIKQEERVILNKEINALAEKIESEGQLNYVISSLCLRVLDKEILNYAAINKILGVLCCVALEFYRRVAAPYETMKMLDNGDILKKEE